LRANKALAELKGILATIPDQNILINTLFLQEAKDSSAIDKKLLNYFCTNTSNQYFYKMIERKLKTQLKQHWNSGKILRRIWRTNLCL